jgi:hypothetical protein
MSIVTCEVRALVQCTHGAALSFAGLLRCPHCGSIQGTGGVWAAPHLVAALMQRYAQEATPEPPKESV